jgi:phosphatidylglycerol---prolipoprotein diacylglyceryl transferase
MPTLGDPVAIALGPIEIRWYALFIVIGISLAVWLAMWLANQCGLNGEAMLDIAPVVVLAAIIGARLYYVILEWDRYRHDLGGAINIREGGLTIHGAIVGGGLAAWWLFRRQKGSVWQWFDCIVPAMALGQAIGRWGNWANQEAFGTPTSLPWAVTIDPSRRPAGYEQFSTFHPTFLYESLLSLLICTSLTLLVVNQQRVDWFRPGMVFGFYFLAYGVIRLILERMRTDSLYIGPLPAAYWLSFAMIAFGIFILYLRRSAEPT